MNIPPTSALAPFAEDCGHDYLEIHCGKFAETNPYTEKTCTGLILTPARAEAIAEVIEAFVAIDYHDWAKVLEPGWTCTTCTLRPNELFELEHLPNCPVAKFRTTLTHLTTPGREQ